MKNAIWFGAASRVALTGMTAIAATTGIACAEAPNLQTKGIVIHLADNLDEADKLGWCIDTLGRGWSDQLQAHSCKPQGGDVQFGYRTDLMQIYSVAFEGKCMALVDEENAEVPLGLIDCDPASANQQFSYDAADGRFSLNNAPEQCVIVGAESRNAGPFMSRDLKLGNCTSTDPELSTWTIQET